MTLLSEVIDAKPSLNAVCWSTKLFQIVRMKESRATNRHARHQTTKQLSLSVKYPGNWMEKQTLLCGICTSVEVECTAARQLPVAIG